jgi:hypothetical protein
MSEARLKNLEVTTEAHGRRITDHDGKLQAIIDWKSSIEESTEVNRRMIEVGEALIEVLGWAGKAAKWTLQIVAFLGACWYGFKHLVGRAVL